VLNFKQALLNPGAEAESTPDNMAVIGNDTSSSGDPQTPDYQAVPAGSVNKTDKFGAWEAEMYSAGHAIIHDKIVVLDPFTLCRGPHPAQAPLLTMIHRRPAEEPSNAASRCLASEISTRRARH
jgi:hypothetical protein